MMVSRSQSWKATKPGSELECPGSRAGVPTMTPYWHQAPLLPKAECLSIPVMRFVPSSLAFAGRTQREGGAAGTSSSSHLGHVSQHAHTCWCYPSAGMCNPAQLAPRPTAVGAGAEWELGTGEFSVAVPCPLARGWAVVVYLPLQVTLQGALTSLRDGEGLRSGVGGQRRHYSLLQVPNWKLLEASPLSGGSLSVSG